MKKFRKLIPALCMLLVSALFVGTSTYAWFSMNTSVTATNMQITAKSDSIYLLISNTAASTSADLIQAENDNKGFTEVTATNTQTEMFPSALATKATTEGVKKTTIDDYGAVASWYSAQAKDVNASAANTQTEKALTADNFTNYVIKYTYRFTLAEGSNAASNLKVKELKVTPNTLTPANDQATIAPVSILVVNHDTQTKVEEFKLQDKTAADGVYTINGTVSLAESVTDNSVVTLDVYVYYDGNNAAVYTNNKANLNGCKFNLTFDVSAAAAAETGN